MKAAPFEFVRAKSMDEVFAAFESHGDDALILAGGQSMMPMLNMRLASPKVLVDINHIAELEGMSVDGGALRIGALTRHSALGASADVARHAPLLKLAVPHIAHPAIRNRGTFGGSISHADPAAELPACAIASDAIINVTGRNGDRTIAAEDFFLGIFDTAIKPGEVLVSVDIPLIGATERVAFAELARRRGDYAMTGLAAKATVDGRTLSDLRLVFFAVADRPLVARATMAALEGVEYAPDTVDAVEQALATDLQDVIGDLHTPAGTKCHLLRVLLGRVLAQLVGGDGQ